ncbi:MAG TPA: hypothetical protein VM144_00815 [Aestuariivirga sp.]|nr:hypothetical protein [Aestuariivirga sp.]
MSRATPKSRRCAERLIAYEAVGKEPSNRKIPAACFATEKLRPHLAILMGRVGFSTLLARSLAFSITAYPWLRTVNVKIDGSFEGFDVLATQVDSEKLIDGCVDILANLLGLLDAIIGEELTLRLVRDVWPELSPNDFELIKGD